MLEFLEKNFAFLIVVTVLGSFVIWSVRKENKEKEKNHKDNKNNEKGGK